LRLRAGITKERALGLRALALRGTGHIMAQDPVDAAAVFREGKP
jgi:hypothetical protein